MHDLSEKFSVRKKLLLVLAGLVLVAAVLAVVFIVPWHSKTREAEPAWNRKNPWLKPGTTQVDWNRINSLSQYNLALNSQSSNANKPVKGQLQVNLDQAEVAQIPQTLVVYKILPLLRSDTEFMSIADRYGIQGPYSKDNISIMDGNRSLRYDPEVDELLYVDREAEKWPKSPPKVPSVEDCKKIAMSFAAKGGLLPKGARVVAVAQSIGGGDSWHGQPDTIIDRTVVIGTNLTLGGYEVRGSGMQMRVSVADKGAVSCMDDSLRRLTEYGTYPTKPIDQALAEAQAGTDTVNLDSEVENPTVDKIDIFYYLDSSDRAHGLLLPVYAFMSDNCCIYIPAVNPK